MIFGGFFLPVRVEWGGDGSDPGARSSRRRHVAISGDLPDSLRRRRRPCRAWRSGARSTERTTTDRRDAPHPFGSFGGRVRKGILLSPRPSLVNGRTSAFARCARPPAVLDRSLPMRWRVLAPIAVLP